MFKKKIKTKLISPKLIHSDEFRDEEEFIEANQYLTNDALNDEESLDDETVEERDEILIEKLKSIDKKNAKKLRTEVVSSELDVNMTTRNDVNSVYKIKTHELLHSLKGASDAATLKKLFAKAHKRTKVLETPMPKHITEKAQRIATYNADKKEVSQWDPIVKKNRKVEQMVFPLKQPDYSLQTASSFTKAWKPETDLEKQIADLLQSSENNLKDQKYLTEAELKAIKTMNFDNLKQKRAEFMKLKAMERYQEAKFKRLKHIKSKKYRKILRKEKEKQEEKNLETLEKNDPIKFKEVLDQIEKDRMKERMSLKHKNTSKWSKAQNRYAKFSDRAREQVQEQLEISKKLTKKVKQLQKEQDSEEEAYNTNNNENQENKTINLLPNGLLDNNPWMRMMGDVGIIKSTLANENDLNKDEFYNNQDYSRPKAFVDGNELKKAQDELDRKIDEHDDNTDDEINNKFKHSDLIHIFDKNIEENEDEKKNEVRYNKKKENENKIEKKAKINKVELLNKDDVINNYEVKKYDEKKKDEKNISPIESINLKGVNLSTKKNDDEKHQITLGEAFADDDVIEEFKDEKKTIVEKERVKLIDLRIPGWGGWAGVGIDLSQIKKKNRRKNNKRYRRKLVIKPEDVLKTEEDKQQMIRRDRDLEHVIISEKKDTKISLFQISELPHQFKNLNDFEKKISQPIGRTWNPEQKFRKLTLPKVKTTIGSIIKPIDKDDIIKNTKK